jgi:hypothetical protein
MKTAHVWSAQIQSRLLANPPTSLLLSPSTRNRDQEEEEKPQGEFLHLIAG